MVYCALFASLHSYVSTFPGSKNLSLGANWRPVESYSLGVECKGAVVVKITCLGVDINEDYRELGRIQGDMKGSSVKLRTN